MLKFTSKYSLNDLLLYLQQKQYISGSQYENIAGYRQNAMASDDTPWYMKLLIMIGAWFSTGFFAAFLNLFGIYSGNSTITRLIIGAVLIYVAYKLDLHKQHTFVTHVALSLSMLGQFLILTTVPSYNLKFWTVFGVALVMSIILYRYYTYTVHRFLSCLLVFFTAVIAILESDMVSLLHVLMVIEIIVTGYLLVKRFYLKKLWQPLFYALILTLFLLFMIKLLFFMELGFRWRSSKIIIIFTLMGLFTWIARQMAVEPPDSPTSNVARFPGERFKHLFPPISGSFILGLLATIGLGIITTPEILASIGVLLLGYYLYDKFLMALGFTFLPIYIYEFYYSLSLPLNTKSFIIGGSGLLLLGFREFLKRQTWIIPAVSENERGKGDL